MTINGDKTMNIEISQQDLDSLVELSSKMVHSIDFSENENFDSDRITFLHLLSQLDTRYDNHELLFDARSIVSCKPFRKLDLYTLTRDLVRMARTGDTDLVLQSTDEIMPVIPAAMLSAVQPANVLAC